MSKATVADELAFEALPIETQELVKRLFGNGSDKYTPGGYTEEEMLEAYEAGWEDACESMEPSTPYFRKVYAEDWLKYNR